MSDQAVRARAGGWGSEFKRRSRGVNGGPTRQITNKTRRREETYLSRFQPRSARPRWKTPMSRRQTRARIQRAGGRAGSMCEVGEQPAGRAKRAQLAGSPRAIMYTIFRSRVMTRCARDSQSEVSASAGVLHEAMDGQMALSEWNGKRRGLNLDRA